MLATADPPNPTQPNPTQPKTSGNDNTAISKKGLNQPQITDTAVVVLPVPAGGQGTQVRIDNADALMFLSDETKKTDETTKTILILVMFTGQEVKLKWQAICETLGGCSIHHHHHKEKNRNPLPAWMMSSVAPGHLFSMWE